MLSCAVQLLSSFIITLNLCLIFENLIYFSLRWKVRRQTLRKKKKKKKQLSAEIQKSQYFFVRLCPGRGSPCTTHPMGRWGKKHSSLAAQPGEVRGGCSSWEPWAGAKVWAEPCQALMQDSWLVHGKCWAWHPGADKWGRLCASPTQDAPPFAWDERDRL